MAEVIHRYVGRGEKFVPAPPLQESRSEQERAELDAEWRRKRISAEAARQRLHEAKMLAMKGELISKRHVQKQAAFLVLSLRARLLAIPGEHARELAGIADERELQSRLDAILRAALDEIAEMPLKVTDERWLEKLDELDGNGREATSAKRPRRAAK